MRKIKLFISVSLDGYIAHNYGGFDLFEDFLSSKDENWNKKAFYDSIDTVFMGANTYYDLLEQSIESPFKDKEIYVFSTRTLQILAGVHFVTRKPMEKIIELKNQTGKDIFVFGGGVFITSLLEENLINNMVINYVPIMLGDGIPLFPKNKGKSKWKLINNSSFESGILQAEYEFNN